MHERKENQSSMESRSPADDQSPWEWKVRTYNFGAWTEGYIFGTQDSGYVHLRYGKIDDGMNKMTIYTGKGETHNFVCRSEDGVVKEMGHPSLDYVLLLNLRDDDDAFGDLPNHIQEELRRVIYSIPDWLEDKYRESIPDDRQETTPIHAV
ncbi:hypothetical protein MYX07_06855 [Patescibacteria group bacterium AH-259-L07]|nr:hypothetical protein [Patescibacteria group bacterium AH-259-L07]